MKRLIIDVRDPEEFASGHVDGAISIPLAELATMPAIISVLPRATEIILYCQSGHRASIAKNVLMAHGFTNVVNGIDQSNVDAQYQ